MLISAVNALTLSPALCGVLLRRGQTNRGPMRYVLRGIDKVRDGYAAIVRRLVRVSIIGVIVVAGVLLLSSDYSADCRKVFCRRKIRVRFSPPCACLKVRLLTAPRRW